MHHILTLSFTEWNCSIPSMYFSFSFRGVVFKPSVHRGIYIFTIITDDILHCHWHMSHWHSTFYTTHVIIMINMQIIPVHPAPSVIFFSSDANQLFFRVLRTFLFIYSTTETIYQFSLSYSQGSLDNKKMHGFFLTILGSFTNIRC